PVSRSTRGRVVPVIIRGGLQTPGPRRPSLSGWRSLTAREPLTRTEAFARLRSDSMRRFVFLLAIGLAVPATAGRAHALVAAPAPVPERVAQAEVIVIGTVGKVEGQNVSAVPFRGAKDKVEFQVVAVKIDEAVAGARGLKEIRVSFVPPQSAPGGGIRPIRRPALILETGP